MRLIGQVSQIGERVEERVPQILDDVGNYRVGLGAFLAIERLDRTEGEGGFDGDVRVRVRVRVGEEEEEDEDEESGGEE